MGLKHFSVWGSADGPVGSGAFCANMRTWAQIHSIHTKLVMATHTWNPRGMGSRVRGVSVRDGGWEDTKVRNPSLAESKLQVQWEILPQIKRWRVIGLWPPVQPLHLSMDLQCDWGEVDGAESIVIDLVISLSVLDRSSFSQAPESLWPSVLHVPWTLEDYQVLCGMTIKLCIHMRAMGSKNTDSQPLLHANCFHVYRGSICPLWSI